MDRIYVSMTAIAQRISPSPILPILPRVLYTLIEEILPWFSIAYFRPSGLITPYI